jgi:hypothetical protein
MATKKRKAEPEAPQEATQRDVLALETVDLAPIRHEVDEVSVVARGDYDQLRVLTLETQAQVDAVAAVLLEAKRRANALDAQRKELVSPLNAAVKRVNDLFREPLRWLDACEAECKRALAAFAVAEERRTAALLAEAARASSAGDVLAAGDHLAAVASVSSLAGVSARPVWRVRVVDAAAVPREFCVPDERLILAHGKANADSAGTPPAIPGVEWYADAQIIARPGK